MRFTLPAMSDSASETKVADIRQAISNASDEDREQVKADFREAEMQREEPRQTVLDATAPSGGPAAERYTHEQLIEGAREYFDVSPLLVAGALSDSATKTFTLDEAEERVKRFAEQEHGTETA